MTDDHIFNTAPKDKSFKTIDYGPRWIRIAFWILVVLLGFVHAWADRHYLVNADTMSYLDVADAYLLRDWKNAINSYWGPLYSWLIALALWIVDPSPYWKFAVVHLTNFFIYLLGFLCFDFMLKGLIRFQHHLRMRPNARQYVTLPGWAWLALGYALFLWSSLYLIWLPLESPDLLVASLTYLAVGWLLRIRQHPDNWVLFLFLGITLGFSYLAKAVMFPLSIIFLAVSFFLAGSFKRAIPRVLLAAVLFALIAGPFVGAISRAKGRLTFGESGQLNYAWSINDTYWIHWQGEEPRNGVPLHPSRKLSSNPPIFEFGEPVGGTYPVWFDPTYWNEGLTSRFDLEGHLRSFASSIRVYYNLLVFGNVQFGLLLVIVTLFLVSRRRWSYILDLSPYWFLILISLAGLGAYSIIVVQARYVAPFLVLLWISALAALKLPDMPEFRRVFTRMVASLAILTVLTATASSYRETSTTLRSLIAGENPANHEQWQVSQGLAQMGITENDTVAVIGDTFRAFWAHLGKLRIVAEIDRRYAESFWTAEREVQKNALQTFASTGAKAVIAERPPPAADLTGWVRIADTPFYAYRLRE